MYPLFSHFTLSLIIEDVKKGSFRININFIIHIIFHLKKTNSTGTHRTPNDSCAIDFKIGTYCACITFLHVFFKFIILFSFLLPFPFYKQLMKSFNLHPIKLFYPLSFIIFNSFFFFSFFLFFFFSFFLFFFPFSSI